MLQRAAVKAFFFGEQSAADLAGVPAGAGRAAELVAVHVHIAHFNRIAEFGIADNRAAQFAGVEVHR